MFDNYPYCTSQDFGTTCDYIERNLDFYSSPAQGIYSVCESTAVGSETEVHLQLPQPADWDTTLGSTAVTCFEMENRYEKPVEDHGWPSLGDLGFHVEFWHDGEGNI
jgi:hypothetical protein